MDIRIPNVPLPEPDRPSPFTHRRVPPSSIDTREEESRFTHPTSARVSSAMTQSPVNYRNDHDEKPVGGSPRSNAALSAYKSAPEVAGDGEYADDFSGADETGTPMSGNKSSRIGVPGGSRHFQSDPVHISVDDAVNEGIENEGDGAPQKHSSATHKAFPPGEHPLNGVPNLNLDELPDPDPLTTVSKQIAGQSGIQSYLGEYVTQCLFSRSWMLRDAAITKTQLLLSSEVEGRDEGEDSVTALVAGLTPVIGVCKVGLDDKNLQVNFSAHGLIEHTLGLLER